MTLQQIHILRMICNLTEQSEKTFYYNSHEKTLQMYDFDKSIDCSKYSSQINGLFDRLQSQGYIKNISDSFFGVDEKCFYLTYKGLHYKHFLLENIFDFILKSFIVPIIVAIITTLLVNKFS